MCLLYYFRSSREHKPNNYYQHQCNSEEQQCYIHLHCRGKSSSSWVQVLSRGDLLRKQQLWHFSDSRHTEWTLLMCACEQSWWRRERYHCCGWVVWIYVKHIRYANRKLSQCLLTKCSVSITERICFCLAFLCFGVFYCPRETKRHFGFTMLFGNRDIGLERTDCYVDLYLRRNRKRISLLTSIKH